MKFARIFIGVFLSLTIVFTVFIGRNKISEGYSFGSAEQYKGVITMWQVDSFEGGAGSRKQFLLKLARSFEKKHEGVLIMVINHTPESVKQSLKNGEKPDLISFGIGVEISGVSELKESNCAGGMVGGKSFATAWCRGGYVLVANPKLVSEMGNDLDSLLVSQSDYTQPLCAFYFEQMSAKEITVKKPMDAYVQFVSGKTPYFLGTQRDINRLERRGMEVISKPLKNYNDLYQYVALTSTDSLKSVYAQSFIEYILSQNAQKSLKEIGMFSVNERVEYQNPHLSAMQAVNSNSTVSAFCAPLKLKEMQENSLGLLMGRKELEINIKNMLV